MELLDHADDCDKIVYEGGGCTCQYDPRGSAAEIAEMHAEGVALAAMESYEGPALDY